jgi:DNA-binding GntR family transcriptional regulator
MIRIFELREVLEGLAARRATHRITPDKVRQLSGFFKGLTPSEDHRNIQRYAEEDRRFHNFLIEVGGDDLMAGILEAYSIITYSYLGEFRGGLVRPPRETLPEHRAIIKAIGNRNPDLAEKAARIHLRRSWEKLVKETAKENRSQGEQEPPASRRGKDGK